MAYKTDAIRNIALVGHAGSGKTTLAEALLAQAGAIKAPGSVERGNTVCDFDSQEKELQHTLDPALCHFDHGGIHVNLIDTPGYPDFSGRSMSVLSGAETAAVVVNAQTGVEIVTQRMMQAAERSQMCRMIIIARIDAPETRPRQVLAQIQEAFGKECLPINLPAEGGKKVVDCFFSPSGDETDFSSVGNAHERIIDQVVEVDEQLMELYLEQGEELSPEQLHDPFEKALREGHLIPVCFVSAKTGAGIPELLKVIETLMPNPTEGNPPAFLKGEGESAVLVEVAPNPAQHIVAHVFKVSVDPFIGRLGIFRIHQGTVKPGTQLYVGDARKPFKVAHLYKVQGKDHIEIPRGVPGDVCAVTKVEEVHYDAVLHDSHDEDRYHLKTAASPPPMYGLAIEPAHQGDEQKLSDALHKLVAEDPSLHIDHNTTLNETVLRGMGDLHLRVVLERMKDRFNVTVKTHPPSIAYRETITRSAEGHHRHKKQTGGAGQFGEVYLKVEVLPRDSGFEFLNKVVGGAIPGQFIPAIEKGVRQVLDSGAIAGYPMQDVRVTVHDGKHHSVDSKEVAFVAAGKKAFLDAIKKANPIVLEPIVNVEITAPSDSMGGISGDFSGKRGRISGNSALPGNRTRISGQIPLAEMNDYQSRLKSLTGGEGSYTMDFSHYERVPPREQRNLMATFKPTETVE